MRPARRAPRPRRCASRLSSASTLATIGVARIVHLHRAQLGRQPSGGWLHQGAMKGCADRQHHDAPGAQGHGALAGARHGVARTRNHHLTAAVHVRRTDDLALRRLLARLRDLFRVQTEDGGHRPGADRNRFLHVPSASPHDPHRVGKRARAGSHVGRGTRQASGRRPAPARGRSEATSRHAATLTARIAGCVFSVRVSRSSGPSKQRRLSGSPSAASASANVSRQIGNASASAFPMPTLCDPCPGKTKAINGGTPRQQRCPARRAR